MSNRPPNAGFEPTLATRLSTPRPKLAPKERARTWGTLSRQIKNKLASGRSGKDLFYVYFCRVVSRVAGGAIRRFVAVGAGFLEAFDREVGQRVGDDKVANFGDGFVGGD